MPWTNPATWSVGQLLTAALLNTQLRDNLNAINPAPATTLPVSPQDGDWALLTDSTTAPTYSWRFRYDATSTSAYKWEYFGGAPIILAVSSTTLPTHAGDYAVTAGGNFGNGGTTTGGDLTANITVGG